MGPIQSLQEFISWIRRRWNLIGMGALLGAVAGVLIALNSEHVYQSSAVIQVVNPVIAVDDSAGGGTGAAVTNVTRRVQAIEQRIMSRDSLLDLADRYELFAGTALTPTEQVVLMRESFSISSIAAAQSGFARDGSLSALIITINNDDPERAAAIANDLAEDVVRQSVDDRQASAQQALEFFNTEESRLQQDIRALETEIAAYMSENEAYLEDSVDARRNEQGRLADSLLELDQQISALQTERAGIDTNSRRAVVQRRLTQINEQLNQLQEQTGVINARIAEIQQILLEAPQFQQEILAYERRMEQLQTQLTSAAASRREAELGVRVAEDQQSERFELLERAVPPDFPTSRSRKVVALAGLVGGIMIGGFLAYLLEWMNPVMRSTLRMERDLELRPVASIPYTMPPTERRRRTVIWVFGLMVLVLALVAVAIFFGLI